MGLAPSTSDARAGAERTVQQAERRAVIWHELECARYSADLPLWRELADANGERTRILEIGAGTGRVSLELARRGHLLTALDSDAALLGALEERKGALAISTVLADARNFELARGDFALCLVPMQTLQLLGGEAGRHEFFARARAHLRPGGTLVCAVVEELESFDCAADGVTPAGEMMRDGDELYRSEAISVSSTSRTTRIERQRMLVLPGGPGRERERLTERNVVELDRVSAASLEREGASVGLIPSARLAIPATDEYAGSIVVSFVVG